jgi:hypothetical protein
MISTKEERIAKARSFLKIILGDRIFTVTYSHRRPLTLPKGMNYTVSEWSSIGHIAHRVLNHNDVSILHLFELEEIINNEKYRYHLFLAKLEN